MEVRLSTEAMNVVLNPSEQDLQDFFAPHVVAKILRHLQTITGRALRGEFECTDILAVVFNPFMVEVFYRTKRPDGKTGTQFMRFNHFTSAMRCLPVTFDGMVVMIQEHRRTRGEWVQMLPGGGENNGRAIDVLMSELFAETGCIVTDKSWVSTLGERYMDDGVFSDAVSLLTVDNLEAPPNHNNPEEGIRGIVLVPWDEWQKRSLDGEYDDVFCEIFAGRCSYDQDSRHITVRGSYNWLYGLTK